MCVHLSVDICRSVNEPLWKVTVVRADGWVVGGGGVVWWLLLSLCCFWLFGTPYNEYVHSTSRVQTAT